MVKLLQPFTREEGGQDLADYTLILGVIGVVAIAVIARYCNELICSHTKVILYMSKLYA